MSSSQQIKTLFRSCLDKSIHHKANKLEDSKHICCPKDIKTKYAFLLQMKIIPHSPLSCKLNISHETYEKSCGSYFSPFCQLQISDSTSAKICLSGFTKGPSINPYPKTSGCCSCLHYQLLFRVGVSLSIM